MNFTQSAAEPSAHQHPLISIDEIKSRVTIYDLWDKFGLQEDPHKKVMRSPFRQDQHPSFTIGYEGTRFKDWGSNEGGDVIDFWQMATGISRPEAIAEMRRFCGQPEMVMRPRLPVKQKPFEYPEAMPFAIRDMGALASCGSPSYSLKAISDRKEWNYTKVHDLMKSGCLGEFKQGSSYTTKGEEPRQINLWGRICYNYPHGIKCRPVADTSHKDFWVFGKAQFNLWRGDRLDDPRVNTVIICEGETDLISFYCTYGEPENVALVAMPGCGWNPSPGMWHRIGSHRKVITAFDDDRAGRDATHRVAGLLDEHATYCDMTFLRWMELTNSGAEIRNLEPTGTDVGELAQKKPQLLINAFDKLLA